MALGIFISLQNHQDEFSGLVELQKILFVLLSFSILSFDSCFLVRGVICPNRYSDLSNKV